MTRQIRSRRAGIAQEPGKQRPLYARLLRLRHLNPGGFLCFVFLEGAFTLGILLALAELVSWWGVVVLPVTVALMVKLNDVIAGAVTQPPPDPIRAPIRPPIRQRVGEPADPGPAAAVGQRDLVPPAMTEPRTAPPVTGNRDAGALSGPPPARQWAPSVEDLDAYRQRVRQTASRRYE